MEYIKASYDLERLENGVVIVRFERRSHATKENLEKFFKEQGVESAVSLLSVPLWVSAARALVSSFIVLDCDQGFSTSETEGSADVMIAPQRPDTRKMISTTIDSGVDYELFSHNQHTELKGRKLPSSRPVVGFMGCFGSVDGGTIRAVASQNPNWDFHFVGGNNTSLAQNFTANVKFFDRGPYRNMPSVYGSFNVCVFPCLKSSDHECAPQVFECLASGKPVVTSSICTNVPASRLLVDTARTVSQFEFYINRSLGEQQRNIEVAEQKRRQFASLHSWTNKVSTLRKTIESWFVPLSIVVLTSSSNDKVLRCIASVLNSSYAHFEIVVVSNNNPDQSVKEVLRRYSVTERNFNFIELETNLGFAGGNNIGISKAKGEYVVLLNSDTVVTRPWLTGLLRHFRRHSNIGVLGPVTNSIGNEAQIAVSYSNMEEMHETAQRIMWTHRSTLAFTKNVAFFCVMIPSKVLQTVGPLDESFGRGWFEDDDYNQRVRLAGYRIAIAQDVFVHHDLSTVMRTFPDAKSLFQRNRAYFESKWGKWTPHERVQISEVSDRQSRLCSGKGKFRSGLCECFNLYHGKQCELLARPETGFMGTSIRKDFDALSASSFKKGCVIFLPTAEFEKGVASGQRPARLAVSFARHGWAVFFCRGILNRNPSAHQTGANFRQVKNLGHFYIYSGMVQLMRWIFQSPKCRSETGPSFVIFGHSYNMHLIKLFNVSSLSRSPRIVYDMMDTVEVFREFHGETVWDIHRYGLSIADDVLYVADAILGEISATKNSKKPIYIPNAVDDDRIGISNKPYPPKAMERFLKAKRSICGYIGLVTVKWFDFELLGGTAFLLPEWDFVIFGETDAPTHRVLREVRNIHYLGAVNYSSVPNHLFYFDLCIVPFLINAVTKATSPLKVYECFAAGKEVVSTPLPECMKMGDVHIARTAVEWADIIAGVKFTNRRRNALMEVAARNSWNVRVRQIKLSWAS